MTDPVDMSRWTDEYRPTASAKFSAREAAVAILSEADWSSLLDPSYNLIEQIDDLNHLEWRGLLAMLDTDWDAVTRRRWVHKPRDFESHLIAWMTAHMQRTSYCIADDHDATYDTPADRIDGIRYFNMCDTPEDDSSCSTCDSPDRDDRWDEVGVDDTEVVCTDGWHDGDPESPHEWCAIWYVNGEPEDFVRLALSLASEAG